MTDNPTTLRMGDEGNDFFNLRCWPALAALLNPQPGQHILDIARGNGLTSRHLASLGPPGDVPQTWPLGRGGKFSEILPVLIARIRLKRSQ